MPSHSRDSLVPSASLPSPSPLGPLVEASLELPLEPSESSELLPDHAEPPDTPAQNPSHQPLWGWVPAFNWFLLLLCYSVQLKTYTRHAVWNRNPVNDLMIKNLCMAIEPIWTVTKGQKIYFRDLTKVVLSRNGTMITTPRMLLTESWKLSRLPWLKAVWGNYRNVNLAQPSQCKYIPSWLLTDINEMSSTPHCWR